jgi:hypothetical protein
VVSAADPYGRNLGFLDRSMVNNSSWKIRKHEFGSAIPEKCKFWLYLVM